MWTQTQAVGDVGQEAVGAPYLHLFAQRNEKESQQLRVRAGEV